jgi:hypothetical protein
MIEEFLFSLVVGTTTIVAFADFSCLLVLLGVLAATTRGNDGSRSRTRKGEVVLVLE